MIGVDHGAMPRGRCKGPSAASFYSSANLELQESALRAAGCDIIRSEKRSGTTTAGRDELRTILDFLRKGDVLMVTRIDRLARSIGDLQDIVRAVKARHGETAFPRCGILPNGLGLSIRNRGSARPFVIPIAAVFVPGFVFEADF
jgi:hypothetical protein